MSLYGQAYTTLLAVMIAAGITSWTDFRYHRIPNLFCACLALTGFVAHSYFHGVAGLTTSLSGAAVGFSILLIPWFMGVMGGGDVKLLAALGAWLGAKPILAAFAVGGLLGGLIAVVMIVAHRSWQRTANHASMLLGAAAMAGAAGEATPLMAMSKTNRKLPYGIPLCIGAVVVVVSQMNGWWEVL